MILNNLIANGLAEKLLLACVCVWLLAVQVNPQHPPDGRIRDAKRKEGNATVVHAFVLFKE